MSDQKVGHGGSRKIGRDKVKCKAYRDRKTRERNKIKRILQSCGLKAAQAYAEMHKIALPRKAQGMSAELFDDLITSIRQAGAIMRQRKAARQS